MIQVYLKTSKGGCIKNINTLFPLVAMVLEEEYIRVPCEVGFLKISLSCYVQPRQVLAREFDFQFDLHIVLQLSA